MLWTNDFIEKTPLRILCLEYGEFFQNSCKEQLSEDSSENLK